MDGNKVLSTAALAALLATAAFRVLFCMTKSMENKEFTRLTGGRPVRENEAKSPGKSRKGGVAMPNICPVLPVFLIVMSAAIGSAAFLPPAAVQAVEIVPSPPPVR